MKDTTHLGGSGVHGDPVTFLPDIYGYVMLKFGLKSVLDIGCAMGFNTKWLLGLGYDAEGVEGFPQYVAETQIPGRVFLHDYAEGPFNPPRDFDLGLCTEFVEHVDAQYVQNFISTFKHCRYVLMTHALPGQGGFHHVNEQPPEYWINLMSDAGFLHLENESKLMQGTFQPKDRYGRNTLMLFRNVILT